MLNSMLVERKVLQKAVLLFLDGFPYLKFRRSFFDDKS